MEVRTGDDVLRDLKLLRTVHGMSEPHDAMLVAGLLDPLVVFERGVKSLVERRWVLLALVVQ